MGKEKKLVIFGDSAFAEIAHEYFTHDSPYEVAAFTVTAEYLKRESFRSLPVVPFERVAELYPPDRYDLFVALVYRGMNAHRARFYEEGKKKGYRLATYVSSRAFVWHNVQMGDNCFIFENNVIQPFARLGSDVILWSGNHIGHHSVVEDHVFISSHVVVSGFVQIGSHCFIGVNSTIANNIKVGSRCLIGAGSLITRDCAERSLFKARRTEAEAGRTTDDIDL